MQSNEALVDHLVTTGAITSKAIEDAFLAIDRTLFVPAIYADKAYDDRPLPISKAATISQPSTVAMMLEWLDAQPGEKILDVGSGSGWTTALLAHLVGKEGEVFASELEPSLVTQSKQRLATLNLARASVHPALPGSYGLPEHAPFDRILVSAAADSVPESLRTQLAIGGRMVIPVGTAILEIDKIGAGQFNERVHDGFAFVPLR